MLLYLGSHSFDHLRQTGSHVSLCGTGVDSQAAHFEYQANLLVFRAARVPPRAPKSMDFGTWSTSSLPRLSSPNFRISSLMASDIGMSWT